MSKKKKKNISLENLQKFKENLDKDITKHVTLTQAEYNALTTEEKNNGTVYFISDGVANISEADIEYINTQNAQTLTSAKEFTTNTVKNFYTKTETDALLNSKADSEEATTEKSGMFSATDKAKLNGIEDGAQVNTVTGIKGSAETEYRTGEINITSENIGLGNVENKSSETIRSEITKSNVTTALGFTPPTVNEALMSAKEYTNTKIADLINGAPETLDTLGEISQAMSDNKDVVDALDEAIGTKASNSDLTSHTGNTSNPHSVTKAQVGLGDVPNVTTNNQTPTYTDTTTLATLTSGEKLSVAFGKIKLAITNLINHIANKANPHEVTKEQVGLGNVENKSSATIRGELTKSDVTSALGYTPPESDTTYSNATSTADGLLSKEDKSKIDKSLKNIVFNFSSGTGAYLKLTKNDGTSSTEGLPVAGNSVNGLMSIADKVKLDSLTGISLYQSGTVTINSSLQIDLPKQCYYVITLKSSNPPHSIWLVDNVISFHSYSDVRQLAGFGDSSDPLV